MKKREMGSPDFFVKLKRPVESLPRGAFSYNFDLILQLVFVFA